MASGVYDTGTITLTNGSATVTGSGTSWVGNISAGNVLITSDGAVYPVEEVVSATEITLSRPFTGPGGTSASYEIVPTGGVPQALAARINTLITSFQGVVNEAGAGKFGDGSSSQPGIRFTADEDTGIRRTGSNGGALVAGGIDVFPFEAKGGGSMIQSAPTDTTAGRLMPVGAFGLGATESCQSWPNTSLDDVSDVGAGFYRTDSSVNDSPLSYSGAVLIYAIRFKGGAQFTQLLISPTGRMTVRGSNGGTPEAPIWGQWKEVFTTGNVLGTVSESAGQPTGAIIERGSNANGEYVRFADGLQICTASVNFGNVTVDGSGTFASPYTSNAFAPSFPANFIEAPKVSFSFPQPAAGGVAARIHVPAGFGVTTSGLTSVRVARLTSDTTTSDVIALMTAIGRWF